jgi:tRNA threonylcarbamoyladenosine biosynthesis protein TsaE
MDMTGKMLVGRGLRRRMAKNTMGMSTIYLKSLVETVRFGEKLGELALPGDMICLEGDLGAGKTTLTQAIARGLRVPDSCYVTSPSFAILHEYPGRIPLYHMDFYRLHDVSEIEDLGFEEYFYLLGLTVIEWPERAGDLLPANRLRLRIENSGECSRSVHYAYSSLWDERMASLVREHPEFLSNR